MADIKKFQFILDGKIANNFKSELDKIGGTISGLNDTQVVVDFDENATMANFKKLYQKLEKENSDLTVQFRYDINKLMLENAQRELSQLEMYVDTEKANKEILELVKELQNINLKFEVEGITESEEDELFKQGEKIADKIGKIISTHMSIDGSTKIFDNLSDEAKSIIETFTNLNKIKEIKPFDTNNIEKQRKDIENIKAVMSDLEGKGAVAISGSGHVDDSKVEELQKELAEVKDDISSLKGRVDTLEDTTAFDTLSSKVDDFDEKIKNVDGSVENLLNAFKLLSELSLTDLQKVVIPFFNGINQIYKENDGNHISGYWDKLKEEIEGSNVELRELLKLVGLYDSKSNGLKLISDGMVNSGGLIGDNRVLIARKNKNNRLEQTQALKNALDEAYAAGVNVSRILDVVGTKESDVFLEVQETAKGDILGNIYGQLDEDFVNTAWLEATDEQIKKLISDMITLQKMGINVESNLTNIMYDKQNGFSFIDMDLDITKFENDAELMEDHIIRIFGDLEDFYLDKNDTTSANMVSKARERFENLSELVQQSYAEAQDSHSPSKEFEKLENDAVDGVVEGANKNESRLKNVGKQMANNVKAGFKEGMDEIDTTALSPENQSTVLLGDDTAPAIEGQQKLQEEAKETINVFETLEKVSHEALSKDFSTSNKTQAFEQLKASAEEFYKYWESADDHTRVTGRFSEEGTKAAHNFYKSLEEALRKEVAQGRIEKAIAPFYDNPSKAAYDLISQHNKALNWGGTTELDYFIEGYEERLNKFATVNNEVSKNSKGFDVFSHVTSDIKNFVDIIEVAFARINDGFEETLDTDSIKFYFDMLHEGIELAINEFVALKNAAELDNFNKFRDSASPNYDDYSSDNYIKLTDMLSNLWQQVADGVLTSEEAQAKYNEELSRTLTFEQEFEQKLAKKYSNQSSVLLGVDSELKSRIETIKKEQAILEKIREDNDLGDYGEEGSLSDEYYNDAINSIKAMDASYEDVLSTLTKIRDLQKEQHALYGQMNGLNPFSAEHDELQKMHESKSQQVRDLEESLSILGIFEDATDRVISKNMSDSDLETYAKDFVTYIAQAKLELGSMDDVQFANLIQSLSKIQSPVENTRQEIEHTTKALQKLGDVYRAVRNQELEFLDRNPDGTGAIWATSEKDLYNTLYTGHNKGKEYSAEMYARNPLVIDAKGQQFNSITYLGDGADEASRQITELYNRVQELTKAREESFAATGSETKEYIELSKQLGLARTQYDELSKSRNNVYGTHFTDDFVGLAKANGYDALKIENVYDSTNQLATTYAVWSDEQIKNIRLIASGEEELLRLHNELIQANQTEVLSGTDTNVTRDIIEDQKALGELELAFRGVEGSVQGFMSTSGRLATFFTNSPYLARQYADALGGVYQAQVALGNSLEIQGKGRDWNAIEYLGDGSDEASVKITKLRQDMDSLYDKLSGLNVSGTGLGGAVEFSRGDYSYLIRCFEDMGTEYGSYIDAVEKGNIIEKQADENAKQLMIQLYNLEKAYKAISDAKDNVYGTHTTDEFAELAKANGYDSVIFRDIKDSFDKLSRLTDVGIIFDERQVADVKLVNDQIDNLIQKLDRIKVSGLNLPMNIELPKGIEKLTDGSFANSLTGEVFADLKAALESLKELNQTPLSSPTDASTQEQVEQLDKLETELQEVRVEAEKTEETLSQVAKQDPIKDTFGAGTESSEMDKVATATDEAVQAKKDFATANEGVQDSVDGSKSKLQLETELMERLAKSAREAANAKKEFVKANKEVKDGEGASEDKKPKVDDRINKINSYNKADSFFGFVKNDSLDSKRYKNIASEIEDIINKQGKYAISVKDTAEEVQKLEDVTQTFADDFENKFQKQQLALADTLENKIQRITSGKTFDDENTKIISDIDNDIEKLRDINLFDVNDLTTATKVAELISTINQNINKIKNVSNNPIALLPEPEDINKSIGQINKVLSGGFKLPRKLKSEFEELRIAYKNAFDGDGNVKITNAELQKLDNTLSKLNAEFEATGKHKTVFGSLTNRITDMNAKFLAQYFSFQDIIRYAREAYQYVAEIDKQMIELEKVSDMSTSRLAESFEHAKVAAKDLGSTVSDVIAATADWSRLGYNADEAEQLAEVATIYKNVGDGIDISTANESLISTLQGFQMEASQAMKIVDSFNEVANRMPIDSAGIGEALKRSAASFNAANTSLSESISLVTATNAVIQDPTSVGTMWKTVSARIRGAKAELEEMGEDTEGMVESTSKLRDLVKGMTGFDIMEDENTFKSIYDIMVGIGKEWENLSDIDQAALLEALAGKRAGNALAAALQNVDMIEEAYAIAEESSGSAMREQEKWEQGLEARTNKFKASLETLSATVLDSDFLGGLIDAGRGLIDILTAIIDKLGVIPTLLAAIGGGVGISKAFQGNGRLKRSSLIFM